jgi:prevent-host-death family protein
MQNIDIDQAKRYLPELIEQATQGDEVVITKGGQPVAKLIPITKGKKLRQFGSARGFVKIPGDFNESLEEFRK